MTRPDFNLLLTLDAVLSEGSVVKAAKRLRLSPSAMSRALNRLREATGDPLLVKSGRGLVPTPRAVALRQGVSRLVDEVESVLRPAGRLDLSRLVRTFTLRSGEGFVENFGPALISRVAAGAPGVVLKFMVKEEKDNKPLREGTVDLETAVVDPQTAPDLISQSLFRDRVVGVVRRGHPLSRGKVSAARFAAGRHVLVSRRGENRGMIDDALAEAGFERAIAAIVSGFSAAVFLARSSDLIAAVPERHCGVLLEGMHRFRLPLPLPDITVAMLWHPRLDADPAHRWLRACVREVCR